MKINNIINKPLKKFANSNLVDYVCKNYKNDNTKFITAFSVASIVAKDAYGCGVYVYQNEKNKDIPKDKKKFITALDIANGALMVGVQLLAFFTISNSKFSSNLFEKTIGKHFSEDNLKKIGNSIKDVSKQELDFCYKQNKNNVKTAFCHLFSLVSATILAKRVLVPFLAVPLADRIKDKISPNKNLDEANYLNQKLNFKGN